MAEATQENRLKVFISYSRADQDFATQLRTVLDVAGFDAYTDLRDLAAAEEWQQRLSRMVVQADTVLLVLSDESLRSERVNWEMEQALRLAKRLLPVVRRDGGRGPSAEHLLPEPLRRLNFVYFDSSSFGEAIAGIVTAIRTDAAWIQKRTALDELVRRWREQDRPDPSLPTGAELTGYLDWLEQRPVTAPAPSARQVEFIRAAEVQEDERIAGMLSKWIEAGRPSSQLPQGERLEILIAHLSRQIRAGRTPSESLREMVVASQQAEARRKRDIAGRAARRGKVFISYRREDSRYCAGRLYDWLAREFGPENIFIDVDTIEKGRDFSVILNEHLSQVDVMLVLIGDRWLTAADAAGNRRIDDPNDYVRRELNAALAGAVGVIPVLIDSATMPTAKDLPQDLSTLTFRQNYTLTFENFARDVEGLKRHVATQLQSTRAARRMRWVAATLALVVAVVVAFYNFSSTFRQWLLTTLLPR